MSCAQPCRTTLEGGAPERDAIEAQTDEPCNLCGGRVARRVYQLTNFAVLECAACGLRYRTNRPSRDEVARLYNADGYLHSRLFAGWESEAGLQSAAADNFRWGLRRLRGVGICGRLLDVGCGRGLFLRLARDEGWSVAGVEVAHYAAELGRRRLGLDITTGTLEETEFPTGSFDAVTLWDCLEHLDNPVGSLREVRRIVRRGGLCLVMTPNIDSLIHRLGTFLHSLSLGAFRRTVELLYDVHHNYFFSERTLLNALASAGFSTVVFIDRFPACIGRWQTVRIPRWMEVGTNLLDRVARPLGWDYRLLVGAVRG